MIMSSFDIFPVFSMIIVAFMVFVLIKGIKQWSDNNKAPLQAVKAILVKKYSEFHQTQTPMAGDVTGAQGYSTSSTETLYGLFQTEDGQQMRFVLNGGAYRSLHEGQTGVLSYKGTRFISFQ